MKKISLKMKLTLLYTLLMSGVVVIILILLFSLSSRQILSSVQSRLRNRVYSVSDDIEYDNGRLDFDSDLDDTEWGIYLSVYQEDGTYLYGRTPTGFSNTMAFSDNALRTFRQGNTTYYVLDLYTYVKD